MRARIVTSAVAVVLAAGCSGGGHGAAGRPDWAAHASVFTAHVRTSLLHPARGSSAPPPQTILIDRDGRFRIVATSKRFRYRMITNSDGRTATQQWGAAAHPNVTDYRGSRRFLADQAGGLPLRIVQSYLAGTAPPFGVRLRTVVGAPPAQVIATTRTERLRITIRRGGRVTPSTFRPARGHASQVVRQLRPGSRPGAAVAAYWLGPAWMGHRARSSSAASGHGGWYTISYPHVSVGVQAPLGGYSGGTPVILDDGTHATLQVAALRPDGTVSVSTSTGEGSASGEVFLFTSIGNPGKTMAFVFLPHAMITLSGTGVTPRTSRAMARSLRPL
jgi:hypothetical protein